MTRIEIEELKHRQGVIGLKFLHVYKRLDECADDLRCGRPVSVEDIVEVRGLLEKVLKLAMDGHG
jgi:hypothetical protein